MTALTFSEAGAQRAEREEAGIKLPNTREFQTERSSRGSQKEKLHNRYGK
jgi:hypothetical protein